MHVLVGCLDLHLPWSHSLKDKRGAVLRLRGRIRREFEISCSEVGHQERQQRALLGVSAIGGAKAPLERLWERLVEFAESNIDGELIGHDAQVEDWGNP